MLSLLAISVAQRDTSQNGINTCSHVRQKWRIHVTASNAI